MRHHVLLGACLFAVASSVGAKAGIGPGDARRRHRHPLEGPEGAGESREQAVISAPPPEPASGRFG